MKIKSIKFLSDYKQFKKKQIFYFSDNNFDLNETNNITFSILVGRNGSGKTTLMSLIPNLFHYIERNHERIPAEIELIYTLHQSNSEVEVKIVYFEGVVRVSIPGVYDNVQLVQKFSSQKNDYSNINKVEKYIEYSSFHNYVPLSIVTSTFSFHGEYPSPRPGNYIGYRLVTNHNITDIYGNNHYEIGSISRGLLRFVKLFYESENEIQKLLELFELKFTERLLVRYAGGGDEKWEKINKKWVDKHDSDIQHVEMYLNDIEFDRFGRKIRLSNMSSGEKMLLLRTISILNSIENNSIIIIEEPELHLDQVWNRQLTSLFEILFKNYKSHMIIATHDYSIINTVPQTNIIALNNGKREEVHKSTFLASYDELFRILYGDKFKANKIEENYLASLPEKSVDELKKDYEVLGNSIYKYLLFKEIKNRN